MEQQSAQQKQQRRGGRPRHVFTHDQMLRAAHLYYDPPGAKQDTIAQEMGIPTRQVSTLLQQARQEGIVKITIDPTIPSDYAEKVKGSFDHLKEVIVIQDGPSTVLPRRFGLAAAKYFNQLWGERKHGKPFRVALTGGEMFLELVNALPEEKRDDLFVHVPALIGHGRLPRTASHMDALAIASILWARSGRVLGRIEYATVSPHPTKKPGPAARREVEIELGKVGGNPVVRDVVEAMNHIDVIFGGIGIIKPNLQPDVRNRITMESYLGSVVTPEQLYNEGARGDFCYCPFGEQGEKQKQWRFFLTAGHYSKDYWGIDFYKHMVTNGKTVVAIGDQLPAVKAAGAHLNVKFEAEAGYAFFGPTPQRRTRNDFK